MKNQGENQTGFGGDGAHRPEDEAPETGIGGIGGKAPSMKPIRSVKAPQRSGMERSRDGIPRAGRQRGDKPVKKAAPRAEVTADVASAPKPADDAEKQRCRHGATER